MRLRGAGCAKREETKLENYVKAVLYVYPRLERLEKDCEEHIRNRAFMSYDYRTTTERLSEELAEEIIRKGLIRELKRKNGRRDWRPKERGKVFAGASVFSKKKQVEAILRRDGLQGNRQRKKLLSQAGEASEEGFGRAASTGIDERDLFFGLCAFRLADVRLSLYRSRKRRAERREGTLAGRISVRKKYGTDLSGALEKGKETGRVI